MEKPTVAFSAPGKVLLAGGYLVLDRKYTGLVFGLDARIHVHVQTPTMETSPGLIPPEIVVRSPQFQDAEWRYNYRETENDGGIEIIQLKG
jgi:phosphomevalonate kinase